MNNMLIINSNIYFLFIVLWVQFTYYNYTNNISQIITKIPRIKNKD